MWPGLTDKKIALKNSLAYTVHNIMASLYMGQGKLEVLISWRDMIGCVLRIIFRADSEDCQL